MSKKFEFNKETQFFCVDPAHLAEGLEAAKGHYNAIWIKPLDLRLKNLSLDMALLSTCNWISRLGLGEHIPIPAGEFKLLEQLTNLEELRLTERGPLDYSKFSKLRALTVMRGTTLQGIDELAHLEELYLTLWQSESLPKSIGGISSPDLRISASKKLGSIDPACALSDLQRLLLQDLPALQVGKEINKLKSLKSLHVEKCGWTDFSQLRVDTLRTLFMSKAESLAFIKQLKALDDLFFWDVADGDLSPILDHPTLRSVRLYPAKKYYSHKLPELQKALADKHASKA